MSTDDAGISLMTHDELLLDDAYSVFDLKIPVCVQKNFWKFSTIDVVLDALD